MSQEFISSKYQVVSQILGLEISTWPGPGPLSDQPETQKHPTSLETSLVMRHPDELSI